MLPSSRLTKASDIVEPSIAGGPQAGPLRSAGGPRSRPASGSRSSLRPSVTKVRGASPLVSFALTYSIVDVLSMPSSPAQYTILDPSGDQLGCRSCRATV
jgi:hypothetical protein